ncbi:hypothetical protein [Flavobacterium sp. NRK F7]|uniref:hypothetical protein n=1 Tax=Flavobacterium sp. NRK F7 TaxID=2954930 RepID=UPI00209150B3|nr:hypothetical protein [Flavobacterium sp. NRK F7]MCO6164548.1 hypothetical protein [Flavobacterium sp. NRK F7]
MNNVKNIFLILAIVISAGFVKTHAQTIDLGSFQGQPFKIGGGIAANTTYFNSNRNAREPFVYNFTGNVNLSLYSFSMPISYNFTNLGGQLDYQIPFNFNRLSVSPKYKWITAHLGDVSMTFSPYTLAGHQFSGVGVELNPNSPLKFSAMYGRFLKAVEDDGNPNTLPAFKRIGYGSKLEYVKDNYKIGLIGFYAKDLINSLQVVPDAKGITPKENLVIGISAEAKLTPDFRLYTDISNSSLTQDTRAENTEESQGISGLFFNNKTSTQNFNAYKIGFDYKIQKTTLGSSFERVDPNYQTLGAYFFANDLQNIMVNVSRPFFSDKLMLQMNLGVQKDNLDNKKVTTTNRLVGTLNASARFSEKLISNISITNQTTTTNANPDQFTQINQVNPELNNVDQINYRQLSRSANLNTNYNFDATTKNKKSIVVNYSFNQVANEQGGIIRVGQLSSFHNVSTAYSHLLLQSKWGFNSSLNFTHSTIGVDQTSTYGTVLGVNKKFFKDKLISQLSTAINQSNSANFTSQNLNFRFTTSYKLLDQHNFNLSASQIFSQSSGTNPRPNINELTITFGYNYNFGGKKKKDKESQNANLKEKNTLSVKINDETIESDTNKVKKEVNALVNSVTITHSDSIKNDLEDDKNKIVLLLEEYDTISDKKTLKTKEKVIKEEIKELNEKVNASITFEQEYESIVNHAIEQVLFNTRQTNLFSKNYFIQKYALELPNSSRSKEEQLKQVEEAIVTQNIAIDKKDAFALSHLNLVFFLSNNDSVETVKEKLQPIISEEKEAVYKQWFAKEKENKMVDQLELKFVEGYISNYIKKFQIR